MSNLNVPASLLDHVVDYVEVSSLTTKRALDEVQVHRQAQEKAAALRPELLRHMLATGVVTPNHKQAAETMLGAHDTSLQLLKSAVDRIAELTAELSARPAKEKTGGDLGRAEPGGDATVASSFTGVVGGRSTAVKESDRPLMRLAGLG